MSGLPWLASLSAHAAVLVAAVAWLPGNRLEVEGGVSAITVLALPSDHRSPANPTAPPPGTGVQRQRAPGARPIAVVKAVSAALSSLDPVALPTALPLEVPVPGRDKGAAPTMVPSESLRSLTGGGDPVTLTQRPSDLPATTPPGAFPRSASPGTTLALAVLAKESGALVPAAYLETPAPHYPEDARRAGLEGVVQLRARIDAEGRVDDLRVLVSSGHQGLDAAALAGVIHWRFRPAQRDGRQVTAWMDIPVRFALAQDGDRRP
jgi:protein TonB